MGIETREKLKVKDNYTFNIGLHFTVTSGKSLLKSEIIKRENSLIESRNEVKRIVDKCNKNE